MGWLKGKSTGNHRFSHEKLDFPVICPLNQSIDTMNIYEYGETPWQISISVCFVSPAVGCWQRLWFKLWLFWCSSRRHEMIMFHTHRQGIQHDSTWFNKQGERTSTFASCKWVYDGLCRCLTSSHQKRVHKLLPVTGFNPCATCMSHGLHAHDRYVRICILLDIIYYKWSKLCSKKNEHLFTYIFHFCVCVCWFNLGVQEESLTLIKAHHQVMGPVTAMPSVMERPRWNLWIQ